MSCEKCFYKRGANCKVMRMQFEVCWNHTPKELAMQREVEIESYSVKKLGSNKFSK